MLSPLLRSTASSDFVTLKVATCNLQPVTQNTCPVSPPYTEAPGTCVSYKSDIFVTLNFHFRIELQISAARVTKCNSPADFVTQNVKFTQSTCMIAIVTLL